MGDLTWKVIYQQDDSRKSVHPSIAAVRLLVDAGVDQKRIPFIYFCLATKGEDQASR